MIAIDERQFHRPETQLNDKYFKKRGVSVWETRIVPDAREELCGNMTAKDAIIRPNFASMSEEHATERVCLEAEMVRVRQTRLLESCGVSRVVMPIPNLSGQTGVLMVEEDYDFTAPRPVFDGAIVGQSNTGVQFNPADCLVFSMVFMRGEDVHCIGQVHFSWRSILYGVGRALKERISKKIGVFPEDIFVYGSPYAQDGIPVHGKFLEQIETCGLHLKPFTHYSDVNGVRHGALDMGAYARALLHEIGVPDENVGISSVDTVLSDEHYSNSGARELGQPSGRFGVCIGWADR